MINLTDIITKAQRILVIGHMRPDGDCLGAGLSLCYIAEKLGKPANFACDGDAPDTYFFMHGIGKLGQLSANTYDTVICVDCGDILRLGKYQPYLKKAKTTVNIDHHQTNNGFAAVNLVLPAASSTCEILGEIYLTEGLMDKTAAELIFVGLSTDSGHFSHDNTTAKVFTLAARLLDFGCDAHKIVQHLYRSTKPSKLRLTARALSSMRLFCDNKVCILYIKKSDLAACDCTLADTEGIINHGINLLGVEAAACITESAKNSYKVSMRSKSADVSKAAASFGGGGHAHAAGCMAFGMLEDVIDKVSRSMIIEVEGLA